ncbi:MAG: hypothetical protein M3217_07435 [Actinomycetota bacterium]|nr:hypothetical protein [Actinomycetota bacterium]
MHAPDADRQSIFRREAFEHHARGRIAGEIVRLSPRWLNIAFWSVLVLFVAGVGFAGTRTLPRSARGPAAVVEEGDAVVALMPSRYASDIRGGMTLTFASGGISTRLTVESVGEVGANPGRLPSSLRDTPELVGPVVAVTARAPGAALQPGTTGRAEVDLPSERLLFVLVPGLAEAFGS